MAWLDRLVGWTKGKKERPRAQGPAPAPEKAAPQARNPKPAPKKASSPPADESSKLFVRGRQRQSKGDFKGAIRDFTKAIELNPDNVEAYANRGVAREASGDVQGAKDDYTKSIEIQVRTEISRQLADQ